MDITTLFWISIITLYILALLFILLYSTVQAYLTYYSLKTYRTANTKQHAYTAPLQWPDVTVQLPIYNELYVAERLIDAVAALNYPADKLEIQVLDDSDDQTNEIVSRKTAEWAARGVDIQHIHRTVRTGYKAGALRNGLERAKGAYIAVFDADFVPPTNFLIKTIPAFSSPGTGMVQTRWGHINRDHSILTKVQAMTIDAHFYIEQTGRNSNDCFINFNGTAGVWRKECIVDAGNWQDDTLTEDLDLSYRAQMKGWKFIYLRDVVSPGELPPVMSAVKSQQYRWNKGGAETARKLWMNLLRSSQPAKVKWFGTFHLLNSAVFIAVFISAICSIPLLYFKQEFPEYRQLYMWLSIFLINFVVVTWLFYSVSKEQNKQGATHLKKFLVEFPLFLSLSMGLSLHNAIAVIEGYAGRKTPFIRTPKFNAIKSNNIYLNNKLSPLAIAELLLAIYFGWGIYYAVKYTDYTMFPFHLMLMIGYGLVSYQSLFGHMYNKKTKVHDAIAGSNV